VLIDAAWQTIGIRSFLGVTEPSLRAVKIARAHAAATEHHYFGLWDHAKMSLVLARDEELIAYGNPTAIEHLLQLVHRWIDLGMPGASSLKLRVYRSDHPVVTRDDQWLVKRHQLPVRLWAPSTKIGPVDEATRLGAYVLCSLAADLHVT
jgi:hypothetical protein